MTYWLGDVHYNHWARALTEFFNLKPSDDEVEEERDDGEQVDEVHRRHEELELPGRASETDLEVATKVSGAGKWWPSTRATSSEWR